MGLIIKTNKHYITRVPIGLAAIIFLGIFPIVTGFLGAWLSQTLTGTPCNEGNCVWAVLPWLLMFTLPIAAFVLLIYLIIILIDSILLIRKAGK